MMSTSWASLCRHIRGESSDSLHPRQGLPDLPMSCVWHTVKTTGTTSSGNIEGPVECRAQFEQAGPDNA